MAIEIAAYPGEVVTLSGGRPAFSCNRLGQIHRCRIDSKGLANLPKRIYSAKGTRAPQFDAYIKSRRLDLARWPNRDYSDFRGAGFWAHIQAVTGDRQSWRYPSTMKAERWLRPEIAEVHVFPGFDWRDEILPLLGVDIQRHTISVDTPTIDPIKIGNRFYVRNVPEELDAPGEWFISDNRDEIKFIPFPGEENAVPEVSSIPHAFVLIGASNVTIRGFSLSHFTRSAVVIKGDGNRILGNTIANAGEWGIEIDGTDNEVRGNDIHDVGLGGVSAAGGDRRNLVRGSNVVDNNHIFRIGLAIEMNRGPAVRLDGVGHRVSHNLIHDVPHEALRINGNDHLVEFNDIYNVDQDCSDCGAIVGYGDWTQRGVQIRFNSIHDIDGYGLKSFRNGTATFGSPYWFGAAIYLDGGTSGWTVYGNIIYRTAGPKVFVNGGRDNVIENNILVALSNEFKLNIDLAGIIAVQEISDKAFFEARNIPKLSMVPLESEIWKRAYPGLSELMRMRFTKPEGNRISKNILLKYPEKGGGLVAFRYVVKSEDFAWSIADNFLWGGSEESVIHRRIVSDNVDEFLPARSWQPQAGRVAFHTVKPAFQDIGSDNFTIDEHSPVVSSGFQAIPARSIGLYMSLDRVRWPVDRSPRIVDLLPRAQAHTH